MSITSAECRAGRVGIKVSQDDLAKAANVGKRTLMDFEGERREPIPATREAIKRALESYGVSFPAPNHVVLPDPDAEPELPLGDAA